MAPLNSVPYRYTPPPTASFPRGRVPVPEHSIAAADTASVAPQHVTPDPPMAKKSKNAAAAAAEPPAKKSKNAAAVAAAAVKVDGRVFRDAFQVGDEVGVSKFAGRPFILLFVRLI